MTKQKPLGTQAELAQEAGYIGDHPEICGLAIHGYSGGCLPDGEGCAVGQLVF